MEFSVKDKCQRKTIVKLIVLVLWEKKVYLIINHLQNILHNRIFRGTIPSLPDTFWTTESRIYVSLPILILKPPWTFSSNHQQILNQFSHLDQCPSWLTSLNFKVLKLPIWCAPELFFAGLHTPVFNHSYPDIPELGDHSLACMHTIVAHHFNSKSL